MGAHKHGQEEAFAPSPSGNAVKCSCALVVNSKTFKRRLFMHYFYNLLPASGDFAPRLPPWLHPWTPLGDFRPQKANLPTPKKNPVGARGAPTSNV